MARLHDETSIARLLDRAIAHPARLNELRRALKARTGVLYPDALPAAARGGAWTDERYDESLWDNLPV